MKEIQTCGEDISEEGHILYRMIKEDPSEKVTFQLRSAGLQN